MKPIIASYHSPDLDNWGSWKPICEDDFGFLLELEIGAEKGVDLFQVVVCTPTWFARNYEHERYVWGRGFLFVFKYNIEKIQTFVEKYIESCKGESWAELASKINRVMLWEFDDYREYVPNSK